MKMPDIMLTDKEFIQVWNAELGLRHEIDKMEEVLAKPTIQRLRQIQNLIRNALARPMKERDDESDRRSRHYKRMQEILKVGSIWSMYEVEYLEDKLPYNATDLEYQGHSMDISHCKTWIDLWEVADELMIKSGDRHHIFIEGFHEVDSGTGAGKVLELQTGS